MKNTLPWNVTGIPPEIREIARASALREGVSVGEWLSRRIMGGDALAGPPLTGSSPPRFMREESRIDASDPVFRRIDESFRNIAHRLENTERTQADAHRAMSAAAREINAATRDQAQAFEAIATRIDRVERQTDTGTLRHAVRGLHQGLSRLAEQIAKTTNESSEGIAAVANKVEILAGGMASAAEQSEHRSRAIQERFAALDERIRHDEERLKHTEERLAAALQTDAPVAALRARLDSTEERMQESLARHLSDIDRRLEQMSERLQEAQSHGQPNTAVEEALQRVVTRIEALENKQNTAVQDPAATEAPPVLPLAAENMVAAAIPDIVELHLAAAVAAAPEPLPAPMETPVSARENSLQRMQSVQASAENYLSQARRAARPTSASHGMRHHIGASPADSTGMRQRISQSASMAFLFLLLVGAGFFLTRAVQNRAGNLAFNPSPLIALAPPANGAPLAKTQSMLASSGTPPAGGPETDPVAAEVSAPSESIAAASVLPLPISGEPALTQLMAKANAGDPKAAMSLGLKYADGDGVPANDAKAFGWLEIAAEAGEPVAQYRLGTLYERGRGIPADMRQALHWYGEAAKRGNRRAMHNLAVVYAGGTGAERNFPEALRWFTDAAELGLTDSQFNLGVLYERGLGVKPSLAEAYKWYEIAASSGDSQSKARVEALASHITPGDRDAAEKAAKAYRPRPLDVTANAG
jgi:localization factor PodJL